MTSNPSGHSDLSTHAAEQMRQLLHKRRVSHRAFARELGVSPNTITNRCNGVTPLTLDDIEHLCQRFDVPVTYFLGADAPQEQQSRPHVARHDATVEAAIRYSMEHGGERVELSDDSGLTIIEDGQVIATIRPQRTRDTGTDTRQYHDNRHDYSLAA